MLHSARMSGKPIAISSYRTEHGAEVDFIVELEGQVWAIEAKTSLSVKGADLRGLKSFADFYGKKHSPVVAVLEGEERTVEKVTVMPWQKLLKKMGL